MADETEKTTGAPAVATATATATAPEAERRSSVPGADPDEGWDRKVGLLRLKAPELVRVWTDESIRDRFDLREWELSFEVRGRRNLAFLAAAMIGMLIAAAYQIGVMWAWVLAAGLGSLLAALAIAWLIRRPWLVLARGGQAVRILIPNLSREEFRDFFLDLTRIRLEALAAAIARTANTGARTDEDDFDEDIGHESETDDFRRHEHDDWYHPQPIEDGDGGITYALSCRDDAQLFDAVTMCYRGTVRAMHAGEAAGITGPIHFTVNALATPRTDAGAAALDACIAENVAWSAYHGDPIAADAKWRGPDDVEPPAAAAADAPDSADDPGGAPDAGKTDDADAANTTDAANAKDGDAADAKDGDAADGKDGDAEERS